MDKKAKSCGSLRKNKVATFFVMYFTHHCRNINHDIRCLFSVLPRREKAATLSLWRLPQILAFWSILQSLHLSLQHLNHNSGLHCWNLATSIIQVLLKYGCFKFKVISKIWCHTLDYQIYYYGVWDLFIKVL